MPKILIVEDDPMISEIYERKFEEAGFEATVAVNGNEVLKNVADEKYDVVLLDLVLPEMSGIEILKKLKSGEYNPGMKVIIFSNLSSKEDRDQALENGADGFISKTQYNPSDLVSEIKRIMKEFHEVTKNETRMEKNDTAAVEDTDGKKKVLFIEDEEAFIDILGGKLKDEGFDVTIVKNGNLAVKEAMENNFDIIVTDMVLPGIGGEEIIQKLKAEDKTKNIPIIVLTASIEKEELKGVEKYGVEEHFLKTEVSPSEIADKVNELLK